MIDITKLTESDIGRGVVYKAHLADGLTIPREDGVIVSWSDRYVFVRYKHGVKATYPRDLEWLSSSSSS